MKRLFLILSLSLGLFIMSCSSSAGLKDSIRKDFGGDLEDFYEKYEGAPHRMGAEGPKYFDCSGFVRRAYREVYGVELPRTSQAMSGKGKAVSKNELRYGDLVFFDINGRGISHVGIYVGGGEFIHASTKLGVTKNELNMDYYSSRYAGARRILK